VDNYEIIEDIMANLYGKNTTTRKATGDFMLSNDHAVNVKSNNVKKQNYSPNMISIRKLHKWVFEEGKNLSFLFVDYEEDGDELKIHGKPKLVPVQHISWDCLSIEAQGYGVIQKIGELKINVKQTKRAFYEGFLKEYERYMEKEKKKHVRFSKHFIDPSTIKD
jgi:hypothetical protein